MWIRGLFGLDQSCGHRGIAGCVSVFGLRWVIGIDGECLGELHQGLKGCRWLVQVSVYCGSRIPAHLSVHQVLYPVETYQFLFPNVYLFMADLLI